MPEINKCFQCYSHDLDGLSYPKRGWTQIFPYWKDKLYLHYIFQLQEPLFYFPIGHIYQSQSFLTSHSNFYDPLPRCCTRLGIGLAHWLWVGEEPFMSLRPFPSSWTLTFVRAWVFRSLPRDKAKPRVVPAYHRRSRLSLVTPAWPARNSTILHTPGQGSSSAPEPEMAKTEERAPGRWSYFPN